MALNFAGISRKIRVKIGLLGSNITFKVYSAYVN